MRIEVTTNKRKRYIGDLDYEYGVFKKNVKISRHLFKKLDAFGVDAKYFRDVLLPNGYDIEIMDTDEQVIYKTTAEKWSKHGQHYHFKERLDDEDHRAQIFLSRRYFSRYTIPK